MQGSQAGLLKHFASLKPVWDIRSTSGCFLKLQTKIKLSVKHFRKLVHGRNEKPFDRFGKVETPAFNC